MFYCAKGDLITRIISWYLIKRSLKHFIGLKERNLIFAMKRLISMHFFSVFSKLILSDIIEYISWTRIYQYLFKHFRPPKGCVCFAKSQWQHEILISLFTGFLVHWKDISQLTQCLTQCFACYDNSFWDLLWKRIFSMKTNWNGALAQIKEIEQNCVKLILLNHKKVFLSNNIHFNIIL